MIDLEKLQALCDAATPGEWHTFYGGEPLCIGGKSGQICDVTCILDRTFDQAKPDAAFIAAARQAMPELIEEVWELRRETARLSSALDEVFREADDA